MRRLILSVALLLLIGHRTASALTAGELLAECEQLERSWVIKGRDIEIRPLGGASDMMDAGRCWGYLDAYFEMAYLQLHNPENPTAPPTNPLNACPPNGVSLTQVIRMFLQQARNSPGALHQTAFFMIQNMLTNTFPCSGR